MAIQTDSHYLMVTIQQMERDHEKQKFLMYIGIMSWPMGMQKADCTA